MAPFNPNLSTKNIQDFDLDSNISNVTITYEPITNSSGLIEYQYKATVLFKPNVNTLPFINNHVIESNNILKLNIITKTDMSSNTMYYNHDFGMNSNPNIHPGQEIVIEEFIIDDIVSEVSSFEQVQIFVSSNTSKKKRKSTIIYTGPGIIRRAIIKWLRYFGFKRN